MANTYNENRQLEYSVICAIILSGTTCLIRYRRTSDLVLVVFLLWGSSWLE